MALAVAARGGSVGSLIFSRVPRRCLSIQPTEAPTAAARPPHVKFKNSFKRASNVMAEINRESWARMRIKMAAFRPPLPKFNPGDAVEIQYGSEISEANPVTIRGTIIAKRNKGIDSKFTILNSADEEWYKATYPFSSPLLRGMRIMMRNRHSDGLKRARRAKLYYLIGKDPKHYAVDHRTQEATEKAAEKVRRRLLLKAGKVYKKGVSEAQLAIRAANAAAKAKAAASGSGGGKASGGGKTAAKAGAKK